MNTAAIRSNIEILNLETAEAKSAAVEKAMRDFGIAEGNGEKALTDKAEFLFDHSAHFQGEGGAAKAYRLYAEGKVSVRPKAIDLSNKDTMANGASKFGRFIALGQANVGERKQLFAWFNEMDDAGIVTGSRYETLVTVARRQLEKAEVTLSRDEVEAIITGRTKAKAEVSKSAGEAPKAPEAPKAETRSDELDFIANMGAAFRAYAERFPAGAADANFPAAVAAWDAFMASRLASL